MAFSYDAAAYSMPWRRNHELEMTLSFLVGAVVYELGFGMFSSFPKGPIHMAAAVCLFFAFWFGLRARALLKIHHSLAGFPVRFYSFDDLKEICQSKSHQSDLWIGRGFLWQQQHTQRVTDILKLNWQEVVKEALGPIYQWRFVRERKLEALLHPLRTYREYQEHEKRINHQGQSWIHGVGVEEDNLFQPWEHTEGHTLVIGTTGAGKTRCFDLLIAQCILRGETVIIIDPKGDKDLCEKAKRACRELGREEAFVNFHPGKPEESTHIDLLANWTRPTQIATRVAELIQTNSPSDPFKNFAWGALNAVTNGLCLAYRSPSLVTLRHYLECSQDDMIEQALIAYIKSDAGLGERAGAALITEKFEALDKPTLGNRVLALINVYQNEEYGVQKSPEVDGLLNLRFHDKEHFSKMVTSILPILQMLTTGEIGRLLSPSGNESTRLTETFRNMADFIDTKSVVYMGLDSLSDGMVGSAIGSLALSDLAATAGERYNNDKTDEVVNIFVDEAAEVINDTMIQILNKGRGAGFRMFVATQTISDFASRLGSKEKAYKVLGNLNNTISLRCIDLETQKYLADRFPTTKVKSLAFDQGQNTSRDDASPAGGRLGEKLSETEVPLIAPELLGMLPNLEYIANLSGGKVIKGRYPLLK